MDWANLITSVGFPIAACVGMAVYCKNIIDSYRKDMIETIKDNWKEMAKVSEALQDNTDAINELRRYITMKGVGKNEDD